VLANLRLLGGGGRLPKVDARAASARAQLHKGGVTTRDNMWQKRARSRSQQPAGFSALPESF
jgi:hypothetical protein